MTAEQRSHLDALLRHGDLDLGGDVATQRALFESMISAIPLPPSIHTEGGRLGGVPVVTVTSGDVAATRILLYFHGGAYAIGSAALSAGLAGDLAARSGTRAISVDYSLAPEHPYPTALHEGVAVYRALLEGGTAAGDIVIAGESAGGGLALAVTAELLAQGLDAPAAVYVASPWTDLTTSGESMVTRAAADPSLTPAGLQTRALDYAAGADPADGRLSPLFGDFDGFPPLLVQVGGNEVLLDDSTRLAARAAGQGVAVTLDVTPDVPHVFVSFAAILDEADAALERAGLFIRGALAAPLAEEATASSAGAAAAAAPSALPADDPARQLLVAERDDPDVPQVALVGDTYSILVSGAQTAGAYTLIDMTIPAGGGPAPHRHDFEELFIVLEGSIDYTFRGETTTARAGQVVNIPANAPHFFKNTSGATARVLCMCSPAAQEEFFLAVGQVLPTRDSVPPVESPNEFAERLARIGALAPLYRSEMLG